MSRQGGLQEHVLSYPGPADAGVRVYVKQHTVLSVFCVSEGKEGARWSVVCARDKSAGMPGLFSHLLGSHV